MGFGEWPTMERRLVFPLPLAPNSKNVGVVATLRDVV